MMQETLPLELREYCSTEREACMAIFQSNVPRFFRDHELVDYLQFLDSRMGRYFIVVSSGDPVACGGFGIRSESDSACLCWGMVKECRHRRSIGTFLLLTRLRRIIDESNVGEVRLETSQLTYGFFQRFGFSVDSRRADGFALGLDRIRMSMRLTRDNRQAILRRWNAVR